LRLSVTVSLAPTESAEQEARIRAEFASIPESGLIVGSPERCVERIREYQGCGIDQFLSSRFRTWSSPSISMLLGARSSADQVWLTVRRMLAGGCPWPRFAQRILN